MTRFLRILALLLCAVPLARAGSGGSAYSLFGVGDLRLSSSLESAGRAYTGLGYAPASAIGTLSPASWTRIDRVRIEAGMLYEGFSSSDGERSLFRAAANFHGALLAVPVSPRHGVVLTAGFVPYSNVSFNTFTSGSQASTDYVLNNVGSGGLGRGLFGASWAPAPWLGAGATLDYLFGSLEREERLTTRPLSGASGITSTTAQSVTSSGFGTTLGLRFSGFHLLTPALEPLSLGIILTPPTHLSTQTKTVYLYPAERDTTAETEGELGLPLTFGAGLTWTLDGRTVLLADYLVQQWADTRVDGLLPASLRNSRRLALGVERLPSADPSAGWWSRLALRAGAAWSATYVSVAGTGVDEWAVSAGAGLPLYGDARLHLAAEYAVRGTAGNGLVRDNILRVTASLSMSELWFVRIQEE